MVRIMTEENGGLSGRALPGSVPTVSPPTILLYNWLTDNMSIKGEVFRMPCGDDRDRANVATSEAVEERPSMSVMALRFLAFLAAGYLAVAGMVRERKYRHLLTWLAGWALFLTWPRYLICSRCEGYGQMCRSYFLGKYTSLLFPRAEGKKVGPLGLSLELLSLSVMFWAPALALRRDPKALLRYLAAMQAVLLGQFFHACRWCGTRSDEAWKTVCPVHRFWKRRSPQP